MSEFNPLGRFPSLRQLDSPAEAGLDTKHGPGGPVEPGKGRLPASDPPPPRARELASRQVEALEFQAGEAESHLPPLAAADGQALNVLTMALARTAKTTPADKFTTAKIEQVVTATLDQQINPKRQAQGLSALKLDDEAMAHLLRRLGRNAGQFFAGIQAFADERKNFGRTLRWAADALPVNGNSLNRGMLWRGVIEGLPAGTGLCGVVQRAQVQSGVAALVKASGGGARSHDSVFHDATAVLGAGGPGAHPAWLEAAVAGLNLSDRPPASAAAPGAGGADSKGGPSAVSSLMAPLRRQEQLMNAILAANPDSTPAQLFGAFRGLAQGAVTARLIDSSTDLGALMRTLIRVGLRRGVDTTSQLPAMIGGLADGLRAALPRGHSGARIPLDQELVAAVEKEGAGKLKPLSLTYARECISHGFHSNLEHREALNFPGPASVDRK